MRENRSYGSVRGAARKSGPYRDHGLLQGVNGSARCSNAELYMPWANDCLLHVRKVRGVLGLAPDVG